MPPLADQPPTEVLARIGWAEPTRPSSTERLDLAASEPPDPPWRRSVCSRPPTTADLSWRIYPTRSR